MSYEVEAECIAETGKAIIVVIEGHEVWIPQSQVSDDSEVYSLGNSGTLVITDWFAEKAGLL